MSASSTSSTDANVTPMSDGRPPRPPRPDVAGLSVPDQSVQRASKKRFSNDPDQQAERFMKAAHYWMRRDSGTPAGDDEERSHSYTECQNARAASERTLQRTSSVSKSLGPAVAAASSSSTPAVRIRSQTQRAGQRAEQSRDLARPRGVTTLNIAAIPVISPAHDPRTPRAAQASRGTPRSARSQVSPRKALLSLVLQGRVELPEATRSERKWYDALCKTLGQISMQLLGNHEIDESCEAELTLQIRRQLSAEATPATVSLENEAMLELDEPIWDDGLYPILKLVAGNLHRLWLTLPTAEKMSQPWVSYLRTVIELARQLAVVPQGSPAVRKALTDIVCLALDPAFGPEVNLLLSTAITGDASIAARETVKHLEQILIPGSDVRQALISRVAYRVVTPRGVQSKILPLLGRLLQFNADTPGTVAPPFFLQLKRDWGFDSSPLCSARGEIQRNLFWSQPELEVGQLLLCGKTFPSDEQLRRYSRRDLAMLVRREEFFVDLLQVLGVEGAANVRIARWLNGDPRAQIETVDHSVISYVHNEARRWHTRKMLRLTKGWKPSVPEVESVKTWMLKQGWTDEEADFSWNWLRGRCQAVPAERRSLVNQLVNTAKGLKLRHEIWRQLYPDGVKSPNYSAGEMLLGDRDLIDLAEGEPTREKFFADLLAALLEAGWGTDVISTQEDFALLVGWFAGTHDRVPRRILAPIENVFCWLTPQGQALFFGPVIKSFFPDCFGGEEDSLSPRWQSYIGGNTREEHPRVLKGRCFFSDNWEGLGPVFSQTFYWQLGRALDGSRSFAGQTHLVVAAQVIHPLEKATLEDGELYLRFNSTEVLGDGTEKEQQMLEDRLYQIVKDGETLARYKASEGEADMEPSDAVASSSSSVAAY